MEPYVLIFFTVSLLSFLHYTTSQKLYKNILNIFIVLTISSLYLTRAYTMGTDTYTYVDMFNYLANLRSIPDLLSYSLLYNIEIGFTLISNFLSMIFNSPSFLLFAYAVLIYICWTYVFVKSKLNLVLLFASLFSYFEMYYFSFNILRQCVAISISVVAASFLLGCVEN